MRVRRNLDGPTASLGALLDLALFDPRAQRRVVSVLAIFLPMLGYGVCCMVIGWLWGYESRRKAEREERWVK